jgi:hypothetical protein
VDAGALRPALIRLRDALEAADPAATDQALAVLTPQVPSELGEDVERVRALADGYEFDEARQAVVGLLQRL